MLNRLTLVEAHLALANGEITSEQLVRACLERIRQREASIHAWCYINPTYAITQAKLADKLPRKSPLHGIPVGIKDIIDTADQPTEYGCKVYRGFQPQYDAACVTLLRQAGAIIMGKTATAELAFFSPAITVNPHNVEYTPGGSSSGSAAAVADDMVPFALGTQTGGSIIRPAAFCGVVGYKPTFGDLPVAGVKPQSPSLDTLGFLAKTVDDLLLIRRALFNEHIGGEFKQRRVGFVKTIHFPKAQSCAKDLFHFVREQLAITPLYISNVSLNIDEETLTQAHEIIQNFEASRNFMSELTEHSEQVTPKTIALLSPALNWPQGKWAKAQQVLLNARYRINSLFAEYDVLITLSAMGEAPHTLTTTGSSLFNRMWTAMGLPCIHLPVGKGPNGMPLGIQLVGQCGKDVALLESAHQIATLLAL